ncbi:MAG: hypothetical protein HYY18_15475, partial [Planctomycetes bacterium]|nr:hypothetical protein [Planctomycetota bacterium]
VSPSPSLPLPESRYTGVGSTFHTSAAAAADFVQERFPDFPFWPQLHGENMLDQALADPTGTSLPGFFELEKRLQAAPPGAGWVKGQVAGPETLRKAGRGAYHELAERVAENAIWQARRILALSRLPVIAVDEPAWTENLGPASRLAAAGMFARIRAAGAVVGVHSCGKTPWLDVLSLRPDFVNPDVSAGAKAFVDEFAPGLRGLLAAGGWIGWGLVPTTRPVPLGQSRAILKEFLAAIAPLGDRKSVLARSFVTPACGLAALAPEQAEDVLRALYEVSRFLRCDHLGLPPH